MIASVIFIVLTFAFATSEVTAQYTNQSAPFNLVLLSANSTINGSLLSACHEGAAIEGLCLGGLSSESYAQYTFNYSAQATPDPVVGITGTLVCTISIFIVPLLHIEFLRMSYALLHEGIFHRRMSHMFWHTVIPFFQLS